MSRRAQIAMSESEIAAFIKEERVVVVASNGVNGWPHLMPLWYVVRDGCVWAWTYAKSQKVRNLEADARATLQIEAGEEYRELRGVMVEAMVRLHREVDVVAGVGAEIFERYGSGALGDEFMDAVRAQAAKRDAVEFVARRVASWDHRKLQGVY